MPLPPAGPRRWLEWRRELELLADAAYFGLTTLAGFQTLGEEYVGVVQVQRGGRRVPTLARRALLVALHCLLPYALDRALLQVELALQPDPRRASLCLGLGGPGAGRAGPRRWLQRRAAGLAEPRRKLLLQGLAGLRRGLDGLRRLHVACFYLQGAFYHLSKRVAGVTYVSAPPPGVARSPAHPPRPRPGGNGRSVPRSSAAPASSPRTRGPARATVCWGCCRCCTWRWP